jgi:hypothetical protein
VDRTFTVRSELWGLQAVTGSQLPVITKPLRSKRLLNTIAKGASSWMLVTGLKKGPAERVNIVDVKAGSGKLLHEWR